jgi:hypothetical protein
LTSSVPGDIIPGMSWHELLNFDSKIPEEKILSSRQYERKIDGFFPTPIILAEGPFEIAAIDINPCNKTTNHTPELDKYIDDIWNILTLKEGKDIYNNDKVLVLEVVTENNRLKISTGFTDYKTRIVTSSGPEISRKYGLESVAITLATACLLETVDGKLVLAQLGQKTSEANKIGGLHCIGGLLEVENKLPIDITQNLKREIKEELGLTEVETENQISVDYCLGVVQDNKTYAVDILFVCTTSLSVYELKTRNGDGEIKPVLINNSEKEITETLLAFSKTATSSAIGSLYLYGKLKFGDKWAEKIRNRLGRRFGVYKQIDTDIDMTQRMQINISNRLARLGK